MLHDTRNAAVRTYHEMRRLGASDPRAFDVAVTLFRHRQPDVPGEDARFMVSDWVTEDLGQ